MTLLRVPLLLWIIGATGLLMLPVAVMAGIDGNFAAGRPFLYGGIVVPVLTVMVALALNNRETRQPARQQLLAMLAAVTLVPLVAALPLMMAVPGLSLLDAWLEMVSDITTTGLTLLPDPLHLPRAVHLWRALVGWGGGFMAWVAAIAILAPLHIGGYELLLPAERETRRDMAQLGRRAVPPNLRIWRAVSTLAPVYAGLSFVLFLALVTVGEDPFIALCHAMSTLATSGISPVGDLSGGKAGTAGEVVIFLFFIFALTRRSFARDMPGMGRRPFWRDPELKVAAAAILAVTVVLFIRHWFRLVESTEYFGLSLIPRAIWGAVFTATSFLTTTGFTSDQWEIARMWSGLSTPGMLLMGLAVIGGGVATSAGGVKLLRIYVLYKHGRREVSRLIHPSTVGGIGTRDRPVPMQAAYSAWLFFMLMALSITLSLSALTFCGVAFEPATVLTIAAISTTGQLVDVASTVPIIIADLSASAKCVLAGAMALGRLETLAMIALLNPNFWRH